MKAVLFISLLFAAFSVFFVMPTLAVGDQGSVKLINPIGGSAEDPTGKTNLAEIVGGIISKALGIMGSLALVVFVYGGFLWLTSAGNADKVQSGGQAMLWAAIGIFIVFSSYAILKLVLQGLGVSQESDSGAVSQSGNVWCVDYKINLCSEMKLTDCTGEAFPTESACAENLDLQTKAVGAYCLTKCSGGNEKCQDVQAKNLKEAQLKGQTICLTPNGLVYDFITVEGLCEKLSECQKK